MGVEEIRENNQIGFGFSSEHPQTRNKNPKQTNEPTSFNYIFSLPSVMQAKCVWTAGKNAM